jgi:hypothetical protein
MAVQGVFSGDSRNDPGMLPAEEWSCLGKVLLLGRETPYAAQGERWSIGVLE